MSDCNSILRRIAEVEKQLAYLLEQKEEAESTLQSRQEQLERADFATAGTEKHPDEGHTPTAQNLGNRSMHCSTSCIPAVVTPEEKVALFLRLFRGRDDVYPKLWQNQKTGKKGYSPACSNEWVREVCNKPRVKCGECPNQAFLPVTAAVILNHLQGRHVVGVYPTLTDETCWLLAADFDKECWRKDVLAFTETCRRIGVPYAIERSHSGKGHTSGSFSPALLPQRRPGRWGAI